MGELHFSQSYLFDESKSNHFINHLTFTCQGGNNIAYFKYNFHLLLYNAIRFCSFVLPVFFFCLMFHLISCIFSLMCICSYSLPNFFFSISEQLKSSHQSRPILLPILYQGLTAATFNNPTFPPTSRTVSAIQQGSDKLLECRGNIPLCARLLIPMILRFRHRKNQLTLRDKSTPPTTCIVRHGSYVRLSSFARSHFYICATSLAEKFLSIVSAVCDR